MSTLPIILVVDVEVRGLEKLRSTLVDRAVH